MKNILIIGIAILIVIGGYLLYTAPEREDTALPDTGDSEQMDPVTETIESDEFGYQFTYPRDTYVYIEGEESQHADFLSGFMLFDQEEYQEFEESTEPREVPPAIAVRVYDNSDNLSASVWAMQNPRESNSELAFGEPEEAVVGGANATHFVADGLWPINTYVVANGDNVYVLTGMYPDQEAPIYQDFQDIVDSFMFIQTSAQVEDDEMVACTMDARMCPDGSYVGRVAPSCEFAPCPGM